MKTGRREGGEEGGKEGKEEDSSKGILWIWEPGRDLIHHVAQRPTAGRWGNKMGRERASSLKPPGRLLAKPRSGQTLFL